jgi:hypothetical protein
MSDDGDILLTMTEPLALQRLIRQQDSVVSRAQALRAGLSRHAIGYRLRDGGPWRVLLPAVYLALPGAPTQAQWETAAVLYAGPYAMITGAAALRFYEFREIPRRDGDAVDLLLPARFQRASTGCVRVHRTSHMPPMWSKGPSARRYAFPARAVVDTARWLEATDGVRSAPEAELRDLIIKARMPLPLFNPRLYLPSGKFIACPDAWWPDAGVAIEIDSRRWHLSPDDWERTMARHSDLGQYGIVTLHATPHQLRTAPAPFLCKAANAYKAGMERPRLNILTLPAAP